MAFSVGRQFGDFVVEELIGSGGMGSVYRVRDFKHDRTVALKVLGEDVRAEDPGALARFAREARAVGDVSHPAIARVYNSGVDEGVAWIAMQFVDGVTLADLLASEGPVSLTSVIRVLAPIAEALDELHGSRLGGRDTQPRIHRDIKPANIIVSPDGSPGPAATLVDFGISRKVSGADRLTATEVVAGTQGYLAPEGATPSGDRRGPAADQYSLAVVAYRALTGRLPFPDVVLTPEVHTRYVELLTPPSRIRPDVPTEVDDVFRRALATDPRQRFISCSAFIAALQQARDNEARSTPVGRTSKPRRPKSSEKALNFPSTRNTATKFVSRPRGRYKSVGAVILLLALVAIGAMTVPTALTQLTANELPAPARAAFPGLVPTDDADPGFQGTSCTAGENSREHEGFVATVVCASETLSYQVYVMTSPERRNAILTSEAAEVTLSESSGCTVRVSDIGGPAPSGYRTIAVITEDDRTSAMALMTIPASSWESAVTWASSAPLCGERK